MKEHEKRSEARIRSRGPVLVRAAGRDPIPGAIFDVSNSGLGLDMERDGGLSPGTNVTIDGQGFAADGVVTYCEPRQGSVYRLGVELRSAGPS